MALMEKPLPEDATDSDIAVPLVEDGNVEEENLSYSGAVSFIQGQYKRSKDSRLADEERLINVK